MSFKTYLVFSLYYKQYKHICKDIQTLSVSATASSNTHPISSVLNTALLTTIPTTPSETKIRLEMRIWMGYCQHHQDIHRNYTTQCFLNK